MLAKTIRGPRKFVRRHGMAFYTANNSGEIARMTAFHNDASLAVGKPSGKN